MKTIVGVISNDGNGGLPIAALSGDSKYEVRRCSGEPATPDAESSTHQAVRDLTRDSAMLVSDASLSVTEELFLNNKSSLLSDLPRGAVLVISSGASDAFFEKLYLRVSHCGRSDLAVVDLAYCNDNAFLSGKDDAVARTGPLVQDLGLQWHHVPGTLGNASKMMTVNQLLVGLHTTTAAEAMGLAARAGLNTRQVYNIITTAAGSSRAFEGRVKSMLEGSWAGNDTLASAAEKLGSVMDASRHAHFPLPLTSASEQLHISACAQGHGHEDVSGIVRSYLPGTPTLVKDAASNDDIGEVLTPSTSPMEISKIGMIGLGAMGQGMAASLLRAGFTVQGYDVYAPAIDKFLAHGGKSLGAASATEATRDAQVVILMVQNAAQADDILFGLSKSADCLSDGAIVILSSTVPPAFVRDLDKKLKQLGKGISLVDAPVSGGVARAANGTLTIICSGDEPVLSKSRGVLLSMTGTASNLCPVEGGVGAASSVKLVNQLLAGVHIAAAAEAMAFAARLGLDTRAVFEIVKKTDGWSWMLENRTPQMLDADWTPHSALAIFVKDLGIVLSEAKRLGYYAPIASAAHNLYLNGASHGWTKESDAGVVRLWELTGISVARSAGPKAPKGKMEPAPDSEPAQTPPQPLPAKATIDALPAEYGKDVLQSVKAFTESGNVPTLVVLDDDPTGTQTCHDIDVLTVWDAATLEYEFSLNPTGFFILTNSRALPSTEARQLILEICQNVKAAAAKSNKAFEIVLRGDSTLRGHLPEEPEAAEEALGLFDGWVLTPFFSQGGRFTINDVHYVKEDDTLVPASQTPFAQDATFGYKNSNLRQYVLEKCGSRFDESSFLSVTLEDIRLGGPSAVASKLLSVPSNPNLVIIVNAVADSDMHVFVSGLMEAERSGRRYLYRTGAAFVSSRLGIKGIPPLTLEDLGVDKTATGQPGGLVLAGSYVPKTTAQLKVLRERRGDKLHVIELQVDQLVAAESEAIVNKAIEEASQQISSGKDVLVMTSRALLKGDDALSSLNIGSKVAKALVQLMLGIQVRPRYIIAKGGITSSDAATKGLKMRRARILGQAAPGVPLWRCNEETSRHRGVPYVVFPGNVGGEGTLADVVEAWSI